MAQQNALVAALPRIAGRLPTFLPNQRWFAGKSRRISQAEVADYAPLAGTPNALLSVVDVRYLDGGRERYSIPLAMATAGERPRRSVILEEGDAVIQDALVDAHFCRALLAAIASGDSLRTARPEASRCSDGDRAQLAG